MYVICNKRISTFIFYMLVSQRYIYLIRICHKHRKSKTLALETIFFSCSLFFFYFFVCRVKFYEDSSFCTAVSLNSIDCINCDAKPLYKPINLYITICSTYSRQYNFIVGVCLFFSFWKSFRFCYIALYLLSFDRFFFVKFYCAQSIW